MRSTREGREERSHSKTLLEREGRRGLCTLMCADDQKNGWILYREGVVPADVLQE